MTDTTDIWIAEHNKKLIAELSTRIKEARKRELFSMNKANTIRTQKRPGYTAQAATADASRHGHRAAWIALAEFRAYLGGEGPDAVFREEADEHVARMRKVNT